MEIDHLNFDVTTTCGGSIYAENVQEGEETTYDLDSLMTNVQYDNFACPECREMIAKNNEEAREFLK